MKETDVETAKACSSTRTNKSRLMTWTLNNRAAVFLSSTESEQEV